MRPLLFAFAGVVLLFGCQSQTTATVPSAAPTLIAQWNGANDGGEEPSTRVLRTTADWSAAWQQVRRDPARPLDPANEIGVFVALGERRTGGYRVEITGVWVEDDKLVVEYREHAPPPDAMVSQALTHPWALAVITKRELPISFRQVASGGSERGR